MERIGRGLGFRAEAWGFMGLGFGSFASLAGPCWGCAFDRPKRPKPDNPNPKP